METIPQILAHGVRTFGDRLALRKHGDAGASAYTYRGLGAHAAAVADRLATCGVAKGTPVALLCENRPEWAVAYFAIHLLGAVCVPIDARLKRAEIRGILRRSRAHLLLVSQPLAAAARDAADGPRRVTIMTIEDLLAEADSNTSPAVPAASAPDVTGADTAVLSFTSGTTGASKAIVLTHRNLVSNAVAGTQWMDVGADDRLVSILPLNHLFEQTAGLLIPLIVGASVTYPGSLNPRTLLEAMRCCEATLVLMVPAMARLLRKRILSALRSEPRWKRLLFDAGRRVAPGARHVGLRLDRVLFRQVHRAFGGGMRFFICGGAPLDGRLARFFSQLGLPILEGYGLSEAAPVVSCNTLTHYAFGSVGKPLPGVEVRTRTPDGTGDGIGEICVRGPNVMAGYFEDTEATAAVLQDGWLATGDLGRVDEQGYLYVVGRLKDVIVSESGKNVYPAEIEAEIGLCPHVRETCVLGVRTGEGAGVDEEIVALVAVDDEALGPEHAANCEDLLRDEIRGACARLADYKRPNRFGVWPGEFPRTTTLKVMKHEVRRRLGEVTLRPL